MQHIRHGASLGGLLLAALVLLSGCSSIGPGRMVADRTDYNTSLTESWKRQILLNIVKIRYVEPIFFMDVGDIVAGYTLETGGNAGFSRNIYDVPLPITTNNNPVFGNFGRLEFGVNSRYTDRPTVTYKPMTGAPFRKGVMSALPLRNVMTALDTGVSAQFLLRLGVRSINNLLNAALTPSESSKAQAGFTRAAEIMSKLQLSNALNVRIEAAPGSKEGKTILVLGSKSASPETAGLVKELQKLLELDPAVCEYEVSGDEMEHTPRRIVIQTYSLLQIMAAVAARADIPDADIASKRAVPQPASAPGEGVIEPGAVRCASLQPPDAFVSVNYRGHWFYVDDHDLATKRVFSFLMLAFTLMEEKTAAPPLQMTIPVN